MIDTRTEVTTTAYVFSSWRNDPDYADLLPLFVEELPSMRKTLLNSQLQAMRPTTLTLYFEFASVYCYDFCSWSDY